MNEQRRLLVVSGPSGAGKDTVVKYLMEAHPEIEISVSATTRAMRPGEEEGVNYYYMTNAQFEEKLARGEILEHVNYCGKYYGTPKSEVDRRIAAGTTVVLVSHSMEDIAKYADKVLVLDAGHIAMYDTTSAVFARADELLKLGLSVPEVTKVFLRLREWGLCVPADVYTVPYAANILRGMLEKGGAGTC